MYVFSCAMAYGCINANLIWLNRYDSQSLDNRRKRFI